MATVSHYGLGVYCYTCAECEQVKIPDEMAENPVPEPDDEEEVSA